MDLFKYFRSQPVPAPSVGLPQLPTEWIDRAKVYAQEVRDGKRQATPFTALPRAFRALNDRMFRSYDAAITTQFNRDMRPVYGSANAEILTSLYTARAKARSITYNDPHGKAIIRTSADNVVGHRPFRLKMRIGKKNATGKFVAEEDLNAQIEEEWKIAGMPENYTVAGNMSRDEAWCIAEMSAIRDGGILFRRHRNFPYNKYRYAVDLLEIDHLDQNYMGRAPITNNPIRFSIEFDSRYIRRPVALWVLTRHPGDPFNTLTGPANTWRERIDVDDCLLFNNLRDRAEQDIGMTEMDSTIQHLHRTRQYDVALALAAIASCCKPYWIKKNFPTGMTYTTEEMGQFWSYVNQITGPTGTNGTGPNSGAVAKQQQIGVRSNTDVPASTLEFPYGEELMQTEVRYPIEASVHFKKDNLMEAATGVGQAYDAISGDYQNLGFSAARLSQQAPRQNYRRRQGHFKSGICRPEFREWLRSSIMAGVFDMPISRVEEIVNAAHFQGVRWESANPLQDTQATILDYEAGFISEQQIQDEREDGQALSDLYAQREEAMALQHKHGLDFTATDPTKPTESKGVPGQGDPNPNAQPPPKTRPANPVRRRGISQQTEILLAMQGDGRNGFGH